MRIHVKLDAKEDQIDSGEQIENKLLMSLISNCRKLLLKFKKFKVRLMF